MAPPPPRTKGLFADPATHAPVPRMVSRSQVLKTSSGLLYEALAGAYTSPGFDSWAMRASATW